MQSTNVNANKIGLSDFKGMEGIKSFGDDIHNEREDRLNNARNKLTFGVSFLDENLMGIFPCDLIVMGARHSSGKTQMCIITALANAQANKKVLLIALEADHLEIERRLKYQDMCRWWFGGGSVPHVRMGYRDWLCGALDPYTYEQFEKEYDQKKDRYPNLKIYYRKNEFNINDFERLYLSMKTDTDLFIVDHLHFFDFDKHSSEQSEIKTIMQKIRALTTQHKKPVLLVSHIRKADKVNRTIVPVSEDFHGSSEIMKTATKGFSFARSREQNDDDKSLTYFYSTKVRSDGSAQEMVALIPFVFANMNYSREYVLGKLDIEDKNFIPIPISKKPSWAINAIEPKIQTYEETKKEIEANELKRRRK